MSVSPFLLVEDVCARYSVSKRWVLERTRLAAIPHRPPRIAPLPFR